MWFPAAFAVEVAKLLPYLYLDPQSVESIRISPQLFNFEGFSVTDGHLTRYIISYKWEVTFNYYLSWKV